MGPHKFQNPHRIHALRVEFPQWEPQIVDWSERLLKDPSKLPRLIRQENEQYSVGTYYIPDTLLGVVALVENDTDRWGHSWIFIVTPKDDPRAALLPEYDNIDPRDLGTGWPE